MRADYHLVQYPSLLGDGHEYFTVDAAIDEGKKLSHRVIFDIALVDRSQSPTKLCGVIRRGVFKWAVLCSACKGTGREKTKAGFEFACSRCEGLGRKVVWRGLR